MDNFDILFYENRKVDQIIRIEVIIEIVLNRKRRKDKKVLDLVFVAMVLRHKCAADVPVLLEKKKKEK